MKRGDRVKKVGKVSRLRASADESTAPGAGQVDAKRIYKPVKRPVTLRLDADVVAWFKKQGRGYQTRINQALSAWVREQKKRSETERKSG